MAQYSLQELTGSFEAETLQIENEHRAERAEWYALLRQLPTPVLWDLLDAADAQACDRATCAVCGEIQHRLDAERTEEDPALVRIRRELESDDRAA